MPVNPRLSIAVPTYNRAETLDLFLKTYVPMVREHDVAIYISNNNSIDNTIFIVDKWKKEYEYIYCTTIDETVVFDVNVANALKLSKAEYTWMVGDTYEIPKKSLEQVLRILPEGDERFDFIVTNLVGRTKDIDEKVYTDKNAALADLGWTIGCIASTIFHKNVIEVGEFTKYVGTEFSHVGVVFEYIKDRDFKMLWAPDVTVVTLKTPNIKVDFGPIFFSIIFEMWPSFIARLPDGYDASSKAIALKALPQKSNFLGWRYFLSLRSQGVLNAETYALHKDALHELLSDFMKVYLFVLTITPRPVCRVAHDLVVWTRRKNYQIRKALVKDLVR